MNIWIQFPIFIPCYHSIKKENQGSPFSIIILNAYLTSKPFINLIKPEK